MKIKNLHIKEFKGLRDISINFENNAKQPYSSANWNIKAGCIN